MKTKKLMAAVAVALTLCVTIGGTLAWLTDTTSAVTNTFTVGDVEITLDEAKVDTDGVAVTPEERVTANAYKLYPGKGYTKDPTVTVASTSEDCYVFVEVANGLTAIESAEEGDKTIAAQMEEKGWTAYTDKNGKTVYYKAADGTDVVSKAGDTLVVFDNFKISGDVDGTTLAEYKDAKITVTAYAVQAEGFTSATAAWDAAFAE